MTATYSCEALRDDIIALLYNDGEPAERGRARDHLASCVPCRAEFTELKSVRKVLGGWSLPVVTPIEKTPARAGWIRAGLSAAAGLILGLGVAMAGLNTFRSPVPEPTNSLTRRSGTPAGVESDTGAAQFVSQAALQESLRAQESRYQAEIADLRRSLAAASESSTHPAPALSRASNLSPATIEQLLRASEERQARMIEARLTGLRTENDLQRQYDMAQIAAGLAYIDSRTGADAARTSELMKNLVRVTAKPPDR